MRPERILAGLLGVLAAGLVALLVLGPTEGADAQAERPEASAPAPPVQTTTAPAPQTTTAPAPETTTETEPGTTEPEPQLPVFRAGDGTFPKTVTIALPYESQVASRTRKLPAKVRELRLKARATATRGTANDVHGIECTLGRVATYTFLVDPWSKRYVLDRGNPVGHTATEVESGEAPGLVDPPRPNILGLACVSLADRTVLTLRANGELVTTWTDRENSGRFVAVGLTAWSPGGGEKVIFDDVTVKTG